MSYPFDSNHYETYRFGSSAWADEDSLYRASLFEEAGLQIGYWNGRPLHLDSPAPITICAGSGSGKLTTILSYIAAHAKNRNDLWNDPKGEIYATFAHNHIKDGDQAFAYNPFGVLPELIPQHRINPFDILTPESPTLQADARAIARALITPATGDNAFFGRRARAWVAVFLVSLTLQDGKVTIQTLMETVNSIQGEPLKFAKLAEFMFASDYSDLRRTAGEIISMIESAQKTLGSILGEIYGQCEVFDDINVQQSLSGSDFSLGDFCTKSGQHLYVVIPAEHQASMAPVLRLIFQVAISYKSRAPKAPRLHLLIDEIGQMGSRASVVLTGYTYARGANIKMVGVWQDIGQMKRLHGAEAVTTILGSSETQLFFGIREYETAKYLSDTLGSQTLSFDDEARQRDAYHRKMEAIHQGLMSGKNLVDNARAYAHFQEQEHHRSKQSRLLMSPDEILNMPSDRMIGIVRGHDLNPIWMERYRYFDVLDPERFRQNPYYE